MSEAKRREQSIGEIIAEMQAEAARFNKHFGRPRLELIKGGRDSQKVTSSDKKCPPIAAAVRSGAARAKFRGDLVLLCYEGERDKSRNGVAAMQRRRFKLIHSRFTEEEIAILKYCDELFKGAKNE